MGQRKGIFYNLAVIALVGSIWLWQTWTGSSYVSFIPKLSLTAQTKHNLEPRVVYLNLVFERPLEVPLSTLEELETVTNQFSHFLMLELRIQHSIGNLCCSNCNEQPDKYSLYTEPLNIESYRNLSSVIVFVSKKECTHPEDVYYLTESQISQLTPIYINSLRTALGFPQTQEKLLNGLTSSEIQEKNSTVKNYLVSEINSQIDTFNKLLEENNPVVNSEDYQAIQYLSKPKQYTPEEYMHMLITLKRLNYSPSMYREEYFQWDFKIGVYAPLFLPAMFPLVGAIYSRLFLQLS